FVSALLAAGVTPEEMYDEATSRTAAPFGVSAAPLFRLNALEFLKRGWRAPGGLAPAGITAPPREGRGLADVVWSVFEVLPPGLLETSGLRDYLQAVLRARHRPDRFADLPRDLFVVAVDLDRGEAVAFGDEGYEDVPVSRAVEAS